MNKEERAMLKLIRQDIETLNINIALDDNKYYIELIKGNIDDLINR
jgi:hypothetical protein